MKHLISKDVERGNLRYEEVKDIIKSKIQTQDLTDSFYIFDIRSVYDRIRLWRSIMPRVELFYAAKCNTDIEIAKACVRMNTGFDVASASEI